MVSPKARDVAILSTSILPPTRTETGDMERLKETDVKTLELKKHEDKFIKGIGLEPMESLPLMLVGGRTERDWTVWDWLGLTPFVVLGAIVWISVLLLAASAVLPFVLVHCAIKKMRRPAGPRG